jgi:hypothetical protein
MTVVGTGFPNDIRFWSDFTVSIGDQEISEANVKSVSTTEI